MLITTNQLPRIQQWKANVGKNGNLIESQPYRKLQRPEENFFLDISQNHFLCLIYF